MKKITLLLLIIFTFSLSYAQITITDSNVYVLGDNITYQNIFDVDSSFPIGASGENVTWDFSSLSEAGTQLQNDYINSSGLPYASEMPEIDLAEQLNSETNGYFYFDNQGGTEWNRSGAYALDTATGIAIWYKYQDVTGTDAPLELFSYPFTYNTTSASLFKGEGEMISTSSPLPVTIETGQYSFDVDGWGELRLPHIIYPNALRVHIEESFNLVVWFNGTPIIQQQIVDDSYYWFVEGVKGPVMTYIDTSTDGDHTYSAKWFREEATEITPDFIVDSQTGNTDDIFSFTNTSQPIVDSTFSWVFTPSTVTFENGTDATSIHPQVSFDDAGIYTVALTVTNNDFTPNLVTETKTNYITIDNAPELMADFIADNVAITTNGIVNFNNLTVPDNTTDGTTYTWAVSPGAEGTHYAFVNFTTNTDENPSIQFFQDGMYSIQMIATNLNFGNSPVTVTKVNYICVGASCTAGIGDLELNNINMYPNPTSGIINIKSDDYLSISIFDITGKQIYQSKTALIDHKINLSNHSKGFYFVKIQKNNKVLTEKIILK